MQISKSEFLCLVLISLALCLFVSVDLIPSCTYIVYSAGTKVELHIWNNNKLKCVFFILSSFERIIIINEKKKF